MHFRKLGRAPGSGQPLSPAVTANRHRLALRMTLIDARPRAGSTPRHTPMFVPTDLLMVVMVAIWGFNFPVVKYATHVIPPLAFNAVRIALAAIVLLAFAAVTVRSRPSRRQVVLLLAPGVLGNGIYQMVFVGSVVNTDVGPAALLLASSPMCDHVLPASVDLY